MSTIGPNAQFLNDFFEAKPAQLSASSTIVVTDQRADRMQIAREYLAKKFHEVEKAITQKTICFSLENQSDADRLMNLVRSGQIDIHGYIGILFNFAAKAFVDLFQDFPAHLINNVDPMLKLSAGSTSKGIKKTPLSIMIQAGVDSAAHIEEAILKSVIIKRGSRLQPGEFNDAVAKTKEMLLDITQIPLLVLVELESYLFNRGPSGYYGYGLEQVMQERLGHDIKSDAISYNATTHETNLDFDFLKADSDLRARKEKIKTTFDPSEFDVYGCPGVQIIPLFVKYMQQIFDRYLFPNFDELMQHTKFE